jgi:hypothetical protein
MSDGERSLRSLLEDPLATTKLEGLLTKGTPAGQLYALLGLRLRDHAAYQRAAEDFHAPDVEVETIGGCIIWDAPFKQLLDRIKAGQYESAPDATGTLNPVERKLRRPLSAAKMMDD